MADNFPSSPPDPTQYKFEDIETLWKHVSTIDTSPSESISRTREDVFGTKNGANTAFTISVSGTAVDVFKDGVLLKETVGYTISGTAITMLSGFIPDSEAVLEAIIYT